MAIILIYNPESFVYHFFLLILQTIIPDIFWE